MEPASKRRKVIDDGSSEGSQSGSEDNENGGDKNGKKWSDLQHNGMNFYQAYKPHGVKVNFKVTNLTIFISFHSIITLA